MTVNAERNFNLDINPADIVMKQPPKPPIARATQELSNNIAELDHALGRLIDSVRPAMGPPLSVQADDESEPTRGNQSDVAEFVDCETSKIREMIHTINSTITRIEL